MTHLDANEAGKKILAIDTATEACSAALYIDGEIITDYKIAPREHSRLILKMIDKLLADAELAIADMDAIAFGRGPGSFMGLRIAAGVVQGIAFAHDIPVIPVSTLKTIAQRAYEQTQCENILVAIDARMDEVYWCSYHMADDVQQAGEDQAGKGQAGKGQGEEQVISPDKVILPERLQQSGIPYVAAGTGWGSYQERLLSALNGKPITILPDCLPSAEVVAKLAVVELAAGNTVTAAEAIPIYLRNNVAKKPKPFKL
jgi:tRNA threonylcarbamoyladenosine biosynthesis protein TsaB